MQIPLKHRGVVLLSGTTQSIDMSPTVRRLLMLHCLRLRRRSGCRCALVGSGRVRLHRGPSEGFSRRVLGHGHPGNVGGKRGLREGGEMYAAESTCISIVVRRVGGRPRRLTGKPWKGRTVLLRGRARHSHCVGPIRAPLRQAYRRWVGSSERAPSSVPKKG